MGWDEKRRERQVGSGQKEGVNWPGLDWPGLVWSERGMVWSGGGDQAKGSDREEK